jgi:hypothetical protein
LLRRTVVTSTLGLSPAEIRRIERQYGFEFADDHLAFLKEGLPTNARPKPREPGVWYAWDEPWPDWRNGDPDALREQLNWPVTGVLLDVKRGRGIARGVGAPPTGTMRWN